MNAKVLRKSNHSNLAHDGSLPVLSKCTGIALKKSVIL